MLILCDCRHWLFTGIGLLPRLFVITKVSFLHMSLVGQAASQMQLSSKSQIFGFKGSTILVNLNIFLWTKVRSWFYVMGWVWSPMCSYPLTQYSIWPFSDYNFTNDAAETRSWNYGMSNCLTFEWLLKSIWMAQKPISLSQSSLWL